MIRKAPLTNDEVLDLIKPYYVQRSVEDEEDEVSTVWRKYRDWDSMQRKVVDKYIYNYMIPVDMFKKATGKRFACKFKKGQVVRVSNKSRRGWNRRNGATQNVGDSQNFKHLGIGTGKTYMTEKLKEAYEQAGYYYRIKQTNQILIGNDNYLSNVLYSIAQANYYKNKGIQKPTGLSFRPYEEITAPDFFEARSIKGDGIFGPKQLVNGYIREVYVHFFRPRWTKKREGRYLIVFDTGAKGIFTDDYMTRVWDTDYDIDESLMQGCVKCVNKSLINCGHHGVHLENEDCNKKCPQSKEACKTIYDYSDLFNFTHGTALDLCDDKEY